MKNLLTNNIYRFIFGISYALINTNNICKYKI